MKKILSIVGLCLMVFTASAQKAVDDERMQRDIEVSENILGTLFKQQFGKRNFFPYEVTGNYTAGYGVTFRLPADMGLRMVYNLQMSSEPITVDAFGGGDNTVNVTVMNGELAQAQSDLAQAQSNLSQLQSNSNCEDCPKAPKPPRTTRAGRNAGSTTKTFKQKLPADSLNVRLIDAARNFIADYGDLISQLGPEEKITITNRNEGQQFWFGAEAPKRKFISIEATRKDVTDFRQGKINRNQLMAKINIVDSETSDELEPDMELLSSIFDRLYRPDLSKTYYTQGNIYYERLKNYGSVYYMQVYSSNELEDQMFSLPTLGLEEVDKSTRDKKVTELYPAFEKELKENIVDYGRTLKRLKENEVLVFNVTLTRCTGCGIPKTIEVSVKSSVLQDFGAGKISRDAAIAKITVKKGPTQ